MKLRTLLLTLLSCLLLPPGIAVAQNVRFDAPATTAPGAVIYVSSSPANGVPPSNLATTYDSAGNACASNKQDTPAIAGTPCQSGPDSQGRVGFWAPAGTYTWTVCVASQCSGPNTVTLGGSGGGSGNVVVSGTPTNAQIAAWVDATHIQGISNLPIGAGTGQSFNIGDSSTFSAVYGTNSPIGAFPHAMVMTYVGNTNNSMSYHCERGTGAGGIAAPNPPNAGDQLCALGGSAWNGVGWTTGKVNINFFAAETWGGSNNGTWIDEQTTAIGSTSGQPHRLLTPDGSNCFGTPAPGTNGSPTGSLYACFDASGNLTVPSCTGCGGGGGGSPGGSSGNLQYNLAGVFAGFADGTAHQILHGGRTFAAVTSADVDSSVITTGGDVNSSNQVTATHLSVGLPRTQGGLNSTSAGTGLLRDGSTPAASELSGAVVTSGSNATTLGAKFVVRTCQPGLGDGLNPIPAGTYTVVGCRNEFGATWTLTSIKCYTDSGSSTLNAANSASSGLLTGAVTCTNTFASGTQSGTTAITSGQWIVFTFVSDGTPTRMTADASGNIPTS